MMDWVIWGSAGHAKVVAEIISLQGGRVVALFDNNKDAQPALAGVPLYIGEDGLKSWAQQREPGKRYAATVAIGGARGRDRLQLVKLLEDVGLSIGTLVHPGAIVSPSARIGEGSQILAHATLAAEATIGRTCILNHGAIVDHECELGDGVHLAPGAILCGCVRAEANAFIAAGAVVLPRLTLGEGCIVGAGAVVTKNVPPYTTVIGNPARTKR